MSKGLGRIGKAIEAAFEAEPDNAFTTEDLCGRAYPGPNQTTRAQRVAILRAAKGLIARRPHLGVTCFQAETLGGQSVFFGRYRVISYAMARLKADSFNSHKSEATLRVSLAEGGTEHRLVQPGGTWWKHTAIAVAERDGDTETATRLKKENAAEVAALFNQPGSDVEKAVPAQ